MVIRVTDDGRAFARLDPDEVVVDRDRDKCDVEIRMNWSQFVVDGGRHRRIEAAVGRALVTAVASMGAVLGDDLEGERVMEPDGTPRPERDPDAIGRLRVIYRELRDLADGEGMDTISFQAEDGGPWVPLSDKLRELSQVLGEVLRGPPYDNPVEDADGE